MNNTVPIASVPSSTPSSPSIVPTSPPSSVPAINPVEENTGTFGLGNTWTQAIGGYGEHFSMPEPSQDGYTLRSGAHPSVIKQRASAHVAIMKSLDDADPWKSDYDELMCEVALMAKYGAENHYKAMADINITSGSNDKRVLDLVGKEPKGYLRSIGCKVFGDRCLERCYAI